MRGNARLILVALVVGGVFAHAVEAQQRLYFHGFVTQGYGSATDYPIYGIGTDGTADYRSAAFQTRFLITPNDHVVVQLSHQRLGSSNFMEFEDDVVLDWVFYQRRLWGNSIKVGRFPMARGLFNEVRDVGVLLPFFRASKAFYSEGVETVDGASVSRSIGLGDWNVDLTAFTGQFEIRGEFISSEGLLVAETEFKNTYGGQVIVGTPLPGLRVSGTYLDSESKEGGDPFTVWTASVDGTFERFFTRAEYQVADLPGFRYVAYYGQAGVRLIGGLWANTQAEFNTNTVGVPGLGDLEIDAIEDYAFGLSYTLNEHFVLKGEWHTFEGYQVGVPVSPMGPPVENEYFILGISAAF